MNYGKKKASKRQKQISSKATMQGKRVSVRLLKAFILCVFAICLIGLIGGLLFAKRILDNSPEVTPDDVRPKGYTTIVYADDGVTELERFVEAGSNREYKSIDQIPKDLQHAFVATEDERFYEHNGIDPQGILRAAVQGISSGGNFSQGASTLTQQLIKNNVFPDFVNEETFYDRLERKIQEQFLALDIEKQMSKNEIMEAYLNTINLGQNTLGVQSASKRYFNKDVSELTLSECAVLAGITQNPSLYNPITNPEDNAKRRTEVLDKMLDQGYIGQAAYDEAMADDVYARIQSVNGTIGEDSPYSYFIDALSEQVIDDLISRLGYTESQAYNALYSGGLTIVSTQNTTLQQICDEEMNNNDNYPWLTEYGLSYALTVTRADGTIENFGSEAVRNYRKTTYGVESALTFSSEDQARAMVEEWKATIAREGDTYDERITITPQPQASVTLMDQATGQIKAMVGGRGAKETSQSLNRAYRGSRRQPGSCFKISPPTRRPSTRTRYAGHRLRRQTVAVFRRNEVQERRKCVLRSLHCAGCDRPVHELRGGTDDPADHTPARLRVREGKLCHEFPCGKRYVRAHRPRRSDPRRIQLRAMRRLRVHRQRRYVQHTDTVHQDPRP